MVSVARNAVSALDKLESCLDICYDDELTCGKREKFQRYFDDMITYIENDRGLILNYGELYRYGEMISTAFVVSTINEVVAKRMVKKQQIVDASECSLSFADQNDCTERRVKEHPQPVVYGFANSGSDRRAGRI